MIFQPTHYGLYFTPDHIRIAQANQHRPPFKTAADALMSPPALIESERAAALRQGLCYRFFDNVTLGEKAWERVQSLLETSPASDASFDQTGDLLTLAQAFECVRDHPAVTSIDRTHWLDTFAGRVRDLDDHAPDALIDTLWLALLKVCAGIVLEDEPSFAAGVEVFTRTISEDVRPQGFITAAVDGDDGGNMRRQVLASAALTLIAEAASHVGVDLWSYAVRGVSVTTAAIYPIYYFYTTEAWGWEPPAVPLTPDAVQAVFRQHGGYLEMVHHRTGMKDVRTVLDDLRPIFDGRGGGATTLSHGVAVRKRLFG